MLSPSARARTKGKPNVSYQPETGHRYTADAEGLLDVLSDHAKAMIQMGCEPV